VTGLINSTIVWEFIDIFAKKMRCLKNHEGIYPYEEEY
jgi:hypothetical protein